MAGEQRRQLISTPFDKIFDTKNGRELCHATGWQVCFEGDDPDLMANWWDEF